ncbi:MAG: hypothetical protein ACTSP4_11260, partial [Candidatus Hodarchaeales archaeon]
PEIKSFVTGNAISWRKLRVNIIKDFSRELAEDLYINHRDNGEAKVFKDKYYDSWGAVAIKIESRNAWYFPFSLIQLATFSITLDDILTRFERKDFVDLIEFFDIIAYLANTYSVNFKAREVEFLKTIVELTSEKDGLNISLPSFAEISQCMGISATQTRNYWANLDKFFSTGTFINYSKLGLKPVLVKHSRKLTSLEKQYSKYSFFDKGCYYTLLLIPYRSTWVEENKYGNNSDFKPLGVMNRMDSSMNLTHFTENAANRWGPYPGITGKIMKRDPDHTIIYDRENTVNGLHIKDFLILNSLSVVFNRSKQSSCEIGVSESYFSQRLSFLLRNKLCIPRVDLYNCGLNGVVFLVLYANVDGKETDEIMERVNNNLNYFPSTIIYRGNTCLLALIRMPSGWMNEFLLDFQNLTEQGGLFYTKSITGIFHHGRTRMTYINKMDNLHELVVPRKDSEKHGKLCIDWSFEIPT